MKPNAMKSRLIKLFILLLWVILFFFWRVGAYTAPMIGEDGHPADIFLHQPKGPDYLQIARIDGVPIYFHPEHPAGEYEILRATGNLFSLFINHELLTEFELTVFLRWSYSLFQVFIFLLLISLILLQGDLLSPRNVISLIGILVFTITPFSVITSTNLQVDGSVGAFAVGTVGLSLFAFFKTKLPPVFKYGLVLISTFIVGLGKNEWNVALLATLVVCFSYTFLLKLYYHRQVRIEFALLCTLMVGAVLGNIFVYLLDPLNYLGGFDVISRIHSASKITGFFDFLILVLKRSWMILPHLILCVIFLINLGRNISQWHIAVIFLFVYGLFLTGGFFLTQWARFPRYYAPAFMALLFSIVLQFQIQPNIINRKLVGLSFAALLLISFVYIIQTFNLSLYLMDLKERNLGVAVTIEEKEAMSLPAIKPPCIVVTGIAEALHEDFDYIANSLGRHDIETLADKYGRELCE